jgi:hypothetical protein
MDKVDFPVPESHSECRAVGNYTWPVAEFIGGFIKVEKEVWKVKFQNSRADP